MVLHVRMDQRRVLAQRGVNISALSTVVSSVAGTASSAISVSTLR